MLKWLKAWLEPKLHPSPPDFHDPELGTFNFDDEADAFVGTVEIGTAMVALHIAGDKDPDQALRVHARRLVGEGSAFLARIDAFLEQEAARHATTPDLARQIRSLETESIVLSHAQPSVRGMILFKSNHPQDNPHVVWCCSYRDGELTELSTGYPL